MAMTQNGSDAGPFVPARTRARLDRIQPPERHPGLQLDKFSVGGAQKDTQAEALKEVCATKGDKAALDWALKRRNAMLDALGATRFEATTEGPLTLHLSRASALENAGICLHPLHGFCYLPGSGLKGMARAWALTEAGLTEDDPTFTAIFGRSPDPKKNVAGTAGAVVFHDAWPLTWPTLVRDIVTNHHKKYYKKYDENSEPPGDWMEPVPVQFLAVKHGTRFSFALSARPGAEPAPASALVATAAGWLRAALSVNGAGAKTNAGYGTFVPEAGPRPAPPAERSLTVTLDLVSPAFFAGATQDADDCDLRPATLRGLLRWWWRTLHAGRLPVEALKAREALIWGDTKRSGAVRVTVASEGHGNRSKVRAFKKSLVQKGLPNNPNKGHTQGLFYLSYGMDESDKPARHVLEPGGRWKVTLSARDTDLNSDLSVQQALDEAVTALWLLTYCGNVGAKSRKGFGSFADLVLPDGPVAGRLQPLLDALLSNLLKPPTPPKPASSPTLGDVIFREWVVSGTPYSIIDRAGTVIQAFAKSLPTKQHRAALGMPRKPVRPEPGLPARHPAPYHLHVGRTTDGKTVLRFTAFPSDRLRNSPESRGRMEELACLLDAEFSHRPAGGGGSRPGSPGHGTARPVRGFPCPGRYQGERVTVLNEAGEDYRVDFGRGDFDFVPKSDVVLD